MTVDDEARGDSTTAATTAFCRSCGVPLLPSNRFCTGCGAPVSEPAAVPRVVDDVPDAEPPEPPQPPHSPPVVPVAPVERPRVGGWGVAIFFFGLLGGLIGWFHLKGSDRARADHVLKWGLIWSAVSAVMYVGLVLVFTAVLLHSVSHLPASTGFTDTFAAETTTAVATTPAAALGGIAATTTVTGTSTDGYSASATVIAYAPAHANAIPALPSSLRSTLASCTGNPETDAVVPIAVSVTNTTSSFSTELELSMTVDSNYANGSTGIEGDLEFSDGSSACDGASTRDDQAVYSVRWNAATAPGSTVHDDFFLVLHDYYNPNHPDGDSSLQGLLLVPSFSFGPEGAATFAGGAPEVSVLPSIS